MSMSDPDTIHWYMEKFTERLTNEDDNDPGPDAGEIAFALGYVYQAYRELEEKYDRLLHQ